MRLNLPTKESLLVDAIDAEMMPADTEADLHKTSWRVIDAYLAGIRRMKIHDAFHGDLEVTFENQDGTIDLKYEEINRLYLTEMGRYLKMDTGPVADRKGDSLESLRDAAIAHAVLNGLTAQVNENHVKRQALVPFLKYGTVGLFHYEGGEGQYRDHLDIVNPRELRGWPAMVDGLNNLYAIARKRWVPYTWLREVMKEAYGKDISRYDKEKDLGGRMVDWGHAPPDGTTMEVVGGGFGPGHNPSKEALEQSMPGKGDREKRLGDGSKGRYYMPLEEIFVYDDTQTLVGRWIVKCGKKILHDDRYLEDQGLQLVCPLQVARHTDTGRFFARGFVGPLIPFNDNVERLLKSLFKNVMEMDMFGTLFIPGSSGIDTKRWRKGPRPKIEKYDPDPLDPGLKPFALGPQNTGTLPGQIAAMALDHMQRQANQGPYYQGESSGRVDSAAGLGFLFNTGNIALGLPSHGLADAYAGIYGSILQRSKLRSTDGDMLIISTIDDALAGVKLDPATGTMSLDDNPIPDPWQVKIDVIDRTPREEDVQKQELLQLFQMGLVDPASFWITSYENHMNFQGAPMDLIETWRKAKWMIVVTFGDGTTPGGPLDMGKHTQNPEIQLRAVQAFMNRIEFSLASPAVQDAFVKWKEDLETLLGVNFPAGLGTPEDAAMMEQQRMQQQMQAMGGGAGGQPPAPAQM